ncbi:MAG: heme NO-binding domain-containing protein [Candidatus Acidiferrales bacterium]
MKGIIFNLLEEVVTREHGADAWDALLESAGVDGAYTCLGSYSDDEMRKLVDAASEMLKIPPTEVMCWFGRQSMCLLSQQYPKFFQNHKSTRPFLLTLNDIIHPEVRKLYPGADVPVFDFDNSSEDVLLMTYRSHKKLCALAHGFIEGASAYYGQVVHFEQTKCMLKGNSECVFRISFD